ncbi:ACP S-malonyltransferase [Pseudomonadota bacterium]
MTTSNNPVMFIFPGQGSQYRGIGSDLYAKYDAAKKVYATANEELGYDIADISFNDPDDILNLTRYTQPAVLTHSVACLEVFKELTEGKVQAAAAAGHSLGEYTALITAGALSFENALQLVKRRGELMGEHGEGEMLAFPLDLETTRPLAEKFYCGVAGCNLKDQTVVGGRNDDLDAISKAVEELYPRKRAVRLKTEGAFHTYYMVKAAQHYRSELDKAQFDTPTIPVQSNYTGDFHDTDTETIKSRLFLQLFHPVMWYANLQSTAAAGYSNFIEFGGGIGSGKTPEEKRPNLQSMVIKAFRGGEVKPTYNAVINANTLEDTVAALS